MDYQITVLFRCVKCQVESVFVLSLSVVLQSLSAPVKALLLNLLSNAVNDTTFHHWSCLLQHFICPKVRLVLIVPIQCLHTKSFVLLPVRKSLEKRIPFIHSSCITASTGVLFHKLSKHIWNGFFLYNNVKDFLTLLTSSQTGNNTELDSLVLYRARVLLSYLKIKISSCKQLTDTLAQLQTKEKRLTP